MQLEIQTTPDVMVVTVGENRVDAAVAVQFKDAIREAAEGGPPRVVLDLGQVMFLDSSGLGAVIGVRKLLADQTLELSALTPAVAKVFRLTRMDTIFAIHDTVDDALAGGDRSEQGSAPDTAHAC